MFTPIRLLLVVLLIKLSDAKNSSDNIIETCFSVNSALSITESKNLAEETFMLEDSADLPDDLNELFDNYEYEISHKGAAVVMNNQTRSCICQKSPQCILFCSSAIHELHTAKVLQNSSSSDMEIFYISLTLANGTMVRKHLLHDFRAVIYNNFCPISYSLSPEEDPKNSWALFENGTLLRHHDHTYLTGNEFCFDYDHMEDAINPYNCAIQNDMSPMEVANNTSMVISIPFFIVTIIAYCMLPELRNINGKCFISYLTSITLSYSLLSFINLSGLKFAVVPCVLFGFLNHYMQLAHYTWLGILSYDTWQSFSNLVYDPSYARYAQFGWISPLVWTFLTFWAQVTDVPDCLKPGITTQHCGLEVNKWAATIYLYGPCLIVLLFCLFAFVNTSRIIKKNERTSHLYKCNLECPKIRYTLYLRLFVVMGLSWSMDVVSYIFAMCDMATTAYIMDFVNAVQGLYIFISFIGRRSVRNIIKQRWFTKHEQIPSTLYRSYSASE